MSMNCNREKMVDKFLFFVEKLISFTKKMPTEEKSTFFCNEITRMST